MGLKYTVKTIGELRRVLSVMADDLPFCVSFDGCEMSKFEIQSKRDGQPEAFVEFTPVEQWAAVAGGTI